MNDEKSYLLEEYIEAHCRDECPYLADLRRQTYLKALMPRMISGKVQGAFLSLLSKSLKPLRILELGTYTAYATFHLAEGLQKGGLIYSIDKNDELHHVFQPALEKSPFKDKIRLINANALDVIDTLDEAWDVVFIDADKENYPEYLIKILPKIKPGGLLIADNVLWDNKVPDFSVTDKATKALRRFNQMVQEEGCLENVLLPLRDGLMIARKV